MSLTLKRYLNKSPHWQIRGTVAGRHVHRTTHTSDKGIATKIKNKVEKELLEEIELGKLPSITFAQAVEVYWNKGGERKYTIKLLKHFKDTPIGEIGQEEVDKAVDLLYPHATASTINRSLISPFITVMRSAKKTWPKRVDLILIERRKEKKVVVKPASDDHIDKLLPHCSYGLKRLLEMMTFAGGLRTGEALKVKEKNCIDGYIHLGLTKNGEPRMVPIPDGWKYPSSGFGFTTTQGVGRALRKAHKLAGLEYHRGHQIGRHGFAARWLKNKNSIKSLKDAGNWKTLKIVDEIYGHLEQTAVHDTMRELSKKNRAKDVDS